ncbi:MAG: XRE family transcriptional regulator [Betaproteobacteria bacterium]|jgi:HTH-type transcriptional regulator / antitoxin HipB|nr:XRE family transcriptional regulator [Betaproteobacteria bacterium]
MKINDMTLAELALALTAERKRQKLSREDAAAVCGVSTSFIRDAESNPKNCSLGKLAKLINGLGLSLEVPGLEVTRSELPKLERGFGLGLTPPAKTGPRGRIAAAMGGLGQADFGVPDSQLVERAKGGLSDLIPQGSSQPTTGSGLASLVAQQGVKVKSKGQPS